jgi:hypothetical protein
VIAQAFDALGGDDDLDADVTHALGQADRPLPGAPQRALHWLIGCDR